MDVTEIAEFKVDWSLFRISSEPPKHGEIAWTDSGWAIAATTNERKPVQPHWISVAAGVLIRVTGDVLRFNGWKLCLKSGGPESVLFQAFPPPAEPFIIAAE